MDDTRLLAELFATDKTERVGDLIEEFLATNAQQVSWRAVGDRPNNSGTIQAASDPARALIERITNGIDAVIEGAHDAHNGRPDCLTPKEATQVWFGVPTAGLHKLSNAQLRKLAEDSVLLLLLPGDGRARRTVDIADGGIGLTPGQMPTTILSLNESNKLDKFYLAGAFGQGGSATLASSDYTLIASRNAKSPNVIGFTIVRYEPPQGMKLGSYVYLVRSGEVLIATATPEGFGTFATHVRHYGYDLDDYPSPVGPNSLYGRAQGVLFEPVLPFMFENRVHAYRRTMKGSRTALNGAREEGDPDSKLSHAVPLFFSDLGDFGQIGIEYWVLEPNVKSAPNRAFVNGSKPIILTVNGQTHAEWSATLIRKDADLLHIASRMVVHLDCNRLSFDAKRVLFVSNREESRKGMVQNAILAELLGALRSDDRLAQLNDEARQAGLKERDEQAEKEVRREVARMLKLFGFSVTEEAGTSQEKAGKEKGASAKRGPRPDPEPIAVRDPPTFIELLGDPPLTFYPGQRRFVRVRTDAHSKYHSPSEPGKSSFGFIVEGDGLRIAGSTELREGHLRVVVAADNEVAPGIRGRLVVELRPQGARTLTASIDYITVEAPPAKPTGSRINLPRIDIQPVDEKESEEWVNLGWGEDITEVAADYTFANDTLTIRYSTLFPRYRAALDQFAARDVTSAASFQKRYEIWLTTTVLIHWQDCESDASPIHKADLDQDELDNYRRDELRRMAKTAIVYAQREVSQLGMVQVTGTE